MISVGIPFIYRCNFQKCIFVIPYHNRFDMLYNVLAHLYDGLRLILEFHIHMLIQLLRKITITEYRANQPNAAGWKYYY